MRLLLLVFVALVSSSVVPSSATNAGITNFNSDVQDGGHMRFLRWRDDDELAKFKTHGDEERVSGRLEKFSSVVTKVDDVVGAATKASNKWQALTKNLMEFEHATLVSRLSTFDVYKRVNLKKMSYSTLKQMDDVEAKRAEDIANGIKVAPEKFLGSHVGRAQQRFDKEDGSRLLSSVVVSRSAEEGGGQVLLISSSNPTKRDWLLPKGGWDKGEKNNMAALREVIEEGGMDGQLAHALGKLKFSEGDNKITSIAYMMKGVTVYDDWTESLRYRIWVSYDEAIDLLDNRPQMIEVVKRAKIVDEKVKAGLIPELNPKLAKIKLE